VRLADLALLMIAAVTRSLTHLGNLGDAAPTPPATAVTPIAFADTIDARIRIRFEPISGNADVVMSARALIRNRYSSYDLAKDTDGAASADISAAHGFAHGARRGADPANSLPKTLPRQRNCVLDLALEEAARLFGDGRADCIAILRMA